MKIVVLYCGCYAYRQVLGFKRFFKRVLVPVKKDSIFLVVNLIGLLSLGCSIIFHPMMKLTEVIFYRHIAWQFSSRQVSSSALSSGLANSQSIDWFWMFSDTYYTGWWFGTFFIFPYIGLLIIPID